MNIRYHARFEKNFQKRITNNPKLKEKFFQRLQIFIRDPHNPILRDHGLVGSQQGHRSFSVAGDCRVVYRWLSSNEIELYDIGSHNQVYN